MDQERALTLLTTLGVQAVKTFGMKGDGTIDEQGYGRAKKFTAREIAVDERGRWLERLAGKSRSFVVMGRAVDWAPGEVKRRLSSERDGDVPTIEDCARLWMPVDVDDIHRIGVTPVGEVGDGETLALQVMGALGLRGRQVVWHLTNSHGFSDRWRIRLWVRLARAKTCADMRAWAKIEWGKRDGGEDLVDMSVYKPAQPIYTGDPILIGVESPVTTRVGCIEGDALKMKVRAKKPGGRPDDDNIALLDKAGLYIGELRPGQHRIACPWEDEHTDATGRDDDTFYFEPHYNGHDIPAFKCHHGHCAERRWEDVLDQLGIKQTVFSPVDEDDDTPAWVFVHRLRQFWDARDGALIDKEAYDSSHGGSGGRKATPTQRFLSSNKTLKVDMAEFLPGEARTVNRNGIRVLNTYIDRRVEPDEARESGPFVEHLRWLVPDEKERGKLTQWLAWAYRHPGRKITWAPILYGPPGTGKTTLMNVLAECLGKRYMSEPTQAELEDKFTDWAFGKLLVKIEELRSEDKYHVAEKLKPIVANPTVSIRRMHETGFSVKNCCNVIASTNHMEALPIERGDRRYMFVQCCEVPVEERRAHMKALHEWLTETGVEGIAAWLSRVDLRGFRPEDEAPVTRLKKIVIEASKNDFERAVDVCSAFEGEVLVTSTALQELLEMNECKVAVRRVGLIAARRNWLASKLRVRSGYRRVTLWSPTRRRDEFRKVGEMEPAKRAQYLVRLDERLLGGKGTGKWDQTGGAI